MDKVKYIIFGLAYFNISGVSHSSALDLNCRIETVDTPLHELSLDCEEGNKKLMPDRVNGQISIISQASRDYSMDCEVMGIISEKPSVKCFAGNLVKVTSGDKVKVRFNPRRIFRVAN